MTENQSNKRCLTMQEYKERASAPNDDGRSPRPITIEEEDDIHPKRIKIEDNVEGMIHNGLPTWNHGRPSIPSSSATPSQVRASVPLAISNQRSHQPFQPPPPLADISYQRFAVPVSPLYHPQRSSDSKNYNIATAGTAFQQNLTHDKPRELSGRSGTIKGIVRAVVRTPPECRRGGPCGNCGGIDGHLARLCRLPGPQGYIECCVICDESTHLTDECPQWGDSSEYLKYEELINMIFKARRGIAPAVLNAEAKAAANGVQIPHGRPAQPLGASTVPKKAYSKSRHGNWQGLPKTYTEEEHGKLMEEAVQRATENGKSQSQEIIERLKAEIEKVMREGKEGIEEVAKAQKQAITNAKKEAWQLGYQQGRADTLEKQLQMASAVVENHRPQ